MFAPVFLDHNATTPLDERVLEAMLPWLSQRHGNASSRHEYGRAARAAIEDARTKVAGAAGAHATEVVFTSGGTEANNLFMKGAADSLRPGLLVISAIEHPSVREPARSLVRRGWRLREVGVDADCRVDLNDLHVAMRERPALVSVMLANNETGAIQDVGSLGELAQSSGAWFHTDAVQAFGKIDVDFRALNQHGIHAMSISAHKIGGPFGAGALVVDKRVELTAQLAGGGQERGVRSGTENLPAIVGFGEACRMAAEKRSGVAVRRLALRHALERGLTEQGAVIFAREAERLPNTVFFALPDLDGETLVAKLDRAGFAVASGSACSSAHSEPSHVLLAMGVVPELARGAVRVSLGVDTTEQEVRDFLLALSETVFQLKRLAALAG